MRLAVSLLLCACLCLAQMPMTQPFGLPLQPRLSWLGNRSAIPGSGLVGAWDLTVDNLFRYSELVNYWTAEAAVVHLSAETAPDGTSNVWRVDSAEGTNLHRVYRQNATPVGPGTFSCFVKSAGLQWVHLRVYSVPHGIWHFAYFDIQNGVVGTKQDGILAAGIEPVGNGWWRVWASTTSDGSNRAYGVAISLEDNQPAYTHSQEHEGKGIYVWGAQVDEGSRPKPYVRMGDGQSIPNFAPGQTAALQLGSSAVVDTNDPTPGQAGMVFDGVDDFVFAGETDLAGVSLDAVAGEQWTVWVAAKHDST